MQIGSGGIGNGLYQEGMEERRRGLCLKRNLVSRTRALLSTLNVETQTHCVYMWRISMRSSWLSLSVFSLSSGNPPPVKATVSERMVGTVILPGRPVFWREEVGKGMWLRWWRCSWRTGMRGTTRVQNTAEITLRRLSATVTAAIILPGCQVRRGLPYRISPLTVSSLMR